MDRDFLNEIWLQFETEAMEHCTSSEDLLLDTNLNASEGTKIDSLFRAFHSLKGLFGTVGLNQTLELTHLIEDVIDKIRSREMHLNNQIREGWRGIKLREGGTCADKGNESQENKMM